MPGLRTKNYHLQKLKLPWQVFKIFSFYLTNSILLKRACVNVLFSSLPIALFIHKFPSTSHLNSDVVTQEKSSETIALPKGDTWSIHKFGGTCVGTWERIWNVSGIIADDPSLQKAVIVSAMSKVTDRMYSLLDKAQSKDKTYEADLLLIYEKHRDTAVSLLVEGSDLEDFLKKLDSDMQNLKALLQAIYIGMIH